jgi:hypothetical protein
MLLPKLSVGRFQALSAYFAQAHELVTLNETPALSPTVQTAPNHT